MPFVGEDTLRCLVETMTNHPDAIVRPRCHGRAGNPVGFPNSLFPELLRLEGDAGARRLVAASEEVIYVDVHDQGVLVDIDRPGENRVGTGLSHPGAPFGRVSRMLKHSRGNRPKPQGASDDKGRAYERSRRPPRRVAQSSLLRQDS